MSKVPKFSLVNQNGEQRTEKMFAKGKFVLYAYPADFTPGCTLESQDFARLNASFEEQGYAIVGISPDSAAKHLSFCEAEKLPFELLSDPDKTLMQAIGAFGEKTMYGKKVIGVKRTTVVIVDGTIVQTFNNVRAKGHAEKVLTTLS